MCPPDGHSPLQKALGKPRVSVGDDSVPTYDQEADVMRGARRDKLAEVAAQLHRSNHSIRGATLRHERFARQADEIATIREQGQSREAAAVSLLWQSLHAPHLEPSLQTLMPAHVYLVRRRRSGQRRPLRRRAADPRMEAKCAGFD